MFNLQHGKEQTVCYGELVYAEEQFSCALFIC